MSLRPAAGSLYAESVEAQEYGRPSRWRLALAICVFALLSAASASPAAAYDFLTKWGGEGNAPGEFSIPTDIVTEAGDTVLVADDGGHARLQRFTSSGAFISTWGSFGSSEGQFDGLLGIAIDATTGDVYATEAGLTTARVQKFTSSGVFIGTWGSKGSGDGQFVTPAAIATDARTGDVYVTDVGNGRIQKFSSSGPFIATWGGPGAGHGQFNTRTGSPPTGRPVTSTSRTPSTTGSRSSTPPAPT